MQTHTFGRKRIDQRIVTAKNSGQAIIDYDIDNAYPQRLRSYVEKSGTGTKCIRRFAKHIIGRGFVDKSFFGTIINNKGETADDLLRLSVERDFSHFKGVAWHIRYNANFQIIEVNYLNYDHCRLGLPDDFGNIAKIAVYDDWDRKFYKILKTRQIKYYDTFNPSPKVIAEQVNNAGGWDKWQGQVFYTSIRGIEYQKATFDAIINDLVADAGLSEFDVTSVMSDFSAKMTYSHPTVLGDTPTQNGYSERQNKLEELEEFTGPDGGRVFVIDNAQQGYDYLKPILVPDTDKRYEQTNNRINNRIRTFFNIPPILVGEDISQGLGSNDAMGNAFKFYNENTFDERYMVERIFQRVFSLWHTDISPTNDFSIRPLLWQEPKIEVATTTDNTNGTTTN